MNWFHDDTIIHQTPTKTNFADKFSADRSWELPGIHSFSEHPVKRFIKLPLDSTQFSVMLQPHNISLRYKAQGEKAFIPIVSRDLSQKRINFLVPKSSL